MNKEEILVNLKQIKNSLEELETQRDSIQILCIKSELELSLDYILRDYKRVLKENEELKNQEATQRKINELLVKRYSNSIPIQKVKDKIEELNNNRQYLSQFKDYKEKNYTNEEVVNNCVDVLQELLESE